MVSISSGTSLFVSIETLVVRQSTLTSHVPQTQVTYSLSLNLTRTLLLLNTSEKQDFFDKFMFINTYISADYVLCFLVCVYYNNIARNILWYVHCVGSFILSVCVFVSVKLLIEFFLYLLYYKLKFLPFCNIILCMPHKLNLLLPNLIIYSTVLCLNLH